MRKVLIVMTCLLALLCTGCSSSDVNRFHKMLAGNNEYNSCTITARIVPTEEDTIKYNRTVTLTITNVSRNYQVASVRYSDEIGRTSYFNNITISGKNVYYPTSEMVRLNNSASSDEATYFDYIQDTLDSPLLYMSDYIELIGDIDTKNVSATFYKTDVSPYKGIALTGKRIGKTDEIAVVDAVKDEVKDDKIASSLLGVKGLSIPTAYLLRGVTPYSTHVEPWSVSTNWKPKAEEIDHAYLEIFVKPKEVNSEGLCTSGAWYRPYGIKVPIQVKFIDDRYYIKITNNNTVRSTKGFMRVADYNGQVSYEKISPTHARLILPIS